MYKKRTAVRYRNRRIVLVATGCVAALCVAGIGFSQNRTNSSIVTAQAAEVLQVEGTLPACPFPEDALTDLLPCYSEDAFVVSYLGVPEGVTTHPLLTELHKSVPSFTYSTEPVAMGASGASNIPYWQTINGDTVGWLRIPGTNINHAVVQGPYTNYYTEKGYDKNYSQAGVIWADSSANLSGGSSGLSSNTVIYGHNWTNYGSYPRVGASYDTMFAQLTSYQHLWFATSHPYIWFSTASEEMVWQVFAAFYTDIDFNYISSAGGQWIVDGAKARSEHIYDVPVSGNDRIITLSTCTRRFGGSNRQRFVVMARLVSSHSAPVTINANPNPVRPNL